MILELDVVRCMPLVNLCKCTTARPRTGLQQHAYESKGTTLCSGNLRCCWRSRVERTMVATTTTGNVACQHAEQHRWYNNVGFHHVGFGSVSAVAFNRSRHAAEPWQQGTCTQDIPQPGRGGQEPHRAMNAAAPESMCVSIGDQTAHQDAAIPTPEEN